MSIELPLLRLGLAGFGLDQQEQVRRLLARAAPPHVTWQPSAFGEADAWWLHGSRSQRVGPAVLRVAAGSPTARALQINLAEVDRPIAFSQPLNTAEFEGAYTFDLNNESEVAAVLRRFTAWLQPLVAQFGLASCLVEHYGALGTGAFDVVLDGRVIAVVDIRGEICVHPTAGPADFADAMWRRRQPGQPVPGDFLKTTISHLMWEYALRTQRDLLPAHYRTGAIFFRRPPRLPQRLMKDAHLLLLRELAMAPGNFADLEQRTGLVGQALSRPLAALYYVGAITSNPKRAAPGAFRRSEGAEAFQGPSSSVLPSVLDPRSPVPSGPGKLGVRQNLDLTAPAPLMPR